MGFLESFWDSWNLTRFLGFFDFFGDFSLFFWILGIFVDSENLVIVNPYRLFLISEHSNDEYIAFDEQTAELFLIGGEREKCSIRISFPAALHDSFTDALPTLQRFE